MKLPKGKFLALAAVFVAIALVTATGAFTTVSAERTATVGVEGDSSALLALTPYDGPNGNPSNGNAGYAQQDSNTLEINLDGYNNDGDGLNLNAKTDIENVFNVTNQGTQTVTLTIEDDSAVNSPDRSTMVTFYDMSADENNPGPGTANLEENEGGSGVDIPPGETVTIGIFVDTTSGPSVSAGEELIDGITINAEATSS